MPTPLNVTKNSVYAQDLSNKFAQRIVGQPEATGALVNVIDKYYSGFYDRAKPIASLLFLGPTGTGKTATVEAFVEGLFGTPTHMFKIDCGEFQHSHEIAKLVGSPPGYLGHRETGALINTVKVNSLLVGKQPEFVVILFDEIEKASDALWQLLLSILDKGVLTLGTNEVVDLKKTVILMTSNVGSHELASKVGRGTVGFDNPACVAVTDAELKEVAVSAARRKFMPEFMNRLDGVVMFNTLTEDSLKEILDIELDILRINVTKNSRAKILLLVSPAAKCQMLVEGYDVRYNARELKRTIEKRVTQPLARTIASGQLRDFDSAIVDYFNGEFTYHVEHNL